MSVNWLVGLSMSNSTEGTATQLEELTRTETTETLSVCSVSCAATNPQISIYSRGSDCP